MKKKTLHFAFLEDEIEEYLINFKTKNEPGTN
jgi:hypothetical protein